SAEGLTPGETVILAEAALTDSDPAAVAQELADDEQALAASGSGDHLIITRTSFAPGRPVPGETVEVAVTVRNQAPDGPPAIFDLTLDDYHAGNRAVAALRRRSLAP